MKKMIKMFAALVLSACFASAGEMVNVSGASGIAVGGYDTVGFFTAGKPVHGDPSISTEYKGATYIFSSKENLNTFKANPAKYAPQHGGFCTFGCSVGALFPADVNTWQIEGGKLYFSLNPAIKTLLNKDFEGNEAKATKNWPELVSKNAK